MTPRIGASGPEWSTALAPRLDRPGVDPVPRTGATEAAEREIYRDAPDWSIRGRLEHGPNPWTGSSGGAPGATGWNIRGNGTDPKDRNIQGRNAPGLERLGTKQPGIGTSRATKKETETAAERNGEENKNKSKEQMGKDKKERRREAGGERDEEEAAKHMERGWEQPGKQSTRSRSTGGGAAQEIINRERPRPREKEAAAAARTDKECMNKIQERWEERTRNLREGRGEEKERQAHGTQTGTSGEAMRPDWNIRGAEALDWNVRGGNNPGLERPGPQMQQEMAAGRSGEEHMNMSMDQMGKDTKDERREVGGEGVKGKAANCVEPRRGQPGEQRSRAGTPRGEAAMDWSVRGSRRKKR